MVDYIKEAFNDLVNWLVYFIVDILCDILESCQSYIPTGLISYIMAALQYLNIINQWIPLDIGFTFFVAYYSLKGLLTGIRLVLKAFPGIW